MLFWRLECFHRIFKWLHGSHAIQVIMFGRYPSLSAPLSLPKLGVYLIWWIDLPLMSRIGPSSSSQCSYLIVSIALALTGNWECVGYPLSILLPYWYRPLWIVHLLLFLNALFFNIAICLILIVQLLMLRKSAGRIFHDIVNVGGKFYILERGVVARRFLEVIQVIKLELYHLILVELEGHVVLSCRHWRIYALTWYHGIVWRNLLVLDMAICTAEWIEYRVVFNFPYILEHYFLELTVIHVIT